MLVISVIGGFGMGTSIDWYVEAQRIQSAKTVRDATYGLWAGGAITLIRNGFWAAGILAFFSMLPHITDAADYELGWFRMGFELLPAGLVGVFFGAILAIHLSTISSHLNLGALYFTRDIYQRYIQPEASEKQLVWVGRFSTFVLLIGSFFYGLMMQEITRWLIFALWLMMAGIWLPNILQVVWWRFNAWGYLSGWMANLGISWLVVLDPARVRRAARAARLPAVLAADGPGRGGLRAGDPAHAAREHGPPGALLRDDPAAGLVGPGAPRGGAARASSRRPAAAADAPRPLIRRVWTPEQADAWTREDWIAVVLSPLVFAALMIGVTKLLLLQPGGLLLVLGAVGGAGVIYWVIDPKLRAVSREYEAKQAAYVEQLEQRLRWQEEGGR